MTTRRSGGIGAFVRAAFVAALAAVAIDGAQAASLSGRVVVPDGATFSPAGLLLQRRSSNGLFWENPGYVPQIVGTDGYLYSSIAAGTYRMCYDDNVLLRQCFDGRNETAFAGFDFTPIALAAGDERQEVNLTPQPGDELRGRVTDAYDATTTISWFLVTVYDENGNAFADWYDLQPDPAGNWVIGGVAPGRYYVSGHIETFVTQFWPGDECVDVCAPPEYGQQVTVPAGGAASNIDFAMKPFSVVRVRVLDSATGVEIPQPSVGGWSSIMGPALLRPARYDAASGEHVQYLGPSGDRVAAYAPNYVTRFVTRGNCYSMVDCLFVYPPLVLARDEVRRVTLRLALRDGYIFAHDFE